MKIVLILISLLSTLNTQAGHGVRNGGAIVYCHQSERTYSLDYFLARSFFDQKLKVENFSNSNDSLIRILKLLKEKALNLASLFEHFINLTQNRSDKNATYIWKAAEEELTEIDDQKITNAFAICKGSRFGGVPFTATQAIIRHDFSTADRKQIVFEFDPEALKNITGTQKSFLLVHEWLWDLSKDVEQNRKINYFFHSELLEEMTPQEVTQQLQKFGLR